MNLKGIQELYDLICDKYERPTIRVEWEPDIRAPHNGIYYPQFGLILLKESVLDYGFAVSTYGNQEVELCYAEYVILHEITHHVFPDMLCGSFGPDYREPFDQRVADIADLLRREYSYNILRGL